ncbi:tRNA (guanine-N(7)-)-methyltransferase [Commensalibacter sp. Nvir]|uniref:tRNA (guanine(46)-N(7))-methyltransferase TrmB n=1 Tax=Commensalibacter sp. Nvir TaxID=3069817 RepID=UPI002D5F2EE3|nr:tRNA (guanine-N(7)-)-methyltransferase [Commensalibacter sp. Nvir]
MANVACREKGDSDNYESSLTLKNNFFKERLYGRKKGHAFSRRQTQLMNEFLPKIQFSSSSFTNPNLAFGKKPEQLWLEIGFGNGEHSLERHKRNPEVGYIACEVFENGICSLLSNLVKEYAINALDFVPDMIRIWNKDARVLLKHLPPQSIDKLFLLFPDPWPKARHVKRRFVHPKRLALVHNLLKKSGQWYIASDDPTYQEWVRETMDRQLFFRKILETQERPHDWPSTRYEQKAYLNNREPIFWIFEKII